MLVSTYDKWIQEGVWQLIKRGTIPPPMNTSTFKVRECFKPFWTLRNLVLRQKYLDPELQKSSVVCKILWPWATAQHPMLARPPRDFVKTRGQSGWQIPIHLHALAEHAWTEDYPMDCSVCQILLTCTPGLPRKKSSSGQS